MTLTVFTQIPESVAAGAQVAFTFSTSKTTSESGNSGRSRLRGVKRNYTVSISPDDADEMQAIIMAITDRYPLAMTDYANNHTVIDENCVLDPTTGNYMMGRSWQPATGTLSVFDRILIPNSDMIVKVNGSLAASSSYDLVDFGRIHFHSGLSTGDAVTISGSYRKAVAFMDNPSANMFGRIGAAVQYQFTSMRFEELYEPELRDILAGL